MTAARQLEGEPIDPRVLRELMNRAVPGWEITKAVGPGKRQRELRCPSREHADEHPSFHFDSEKLVGTCRSCGWKGNGFTIAEALHGHDQAVDWLKSTKAELGIGQPKGKAIAKRTKSGLTVTQLAEAKGFTVELLQGFGATDGNDRGAPFVAIPFRDSRGQTVATHRRHSLEKPKSKGEPPKFTWDKPSDVALIMYGLDRLDAARESGFVILVEGETDVWALAAVGITAIGVPGVTSINPADLVIALEGINRIIVWREPGNAALEFVERLASHDGVRARLYVIDAPAEAKDPCELRQRDPERFAERMRKLSEGARSYADIELERQRIESGIGETLDSLERFLRRYVVFADEHQSCAATLWAAHTHIFGQFDCSPRLQVTSPHARSGKTRLSIELMSELTARPEPAVDMTAAALFRAIEEFSPTILFDEVDGIFKRKEGDNLDLRSILNSGYRQGATVVRCTGDNHEIRRFKVFAPVCLAGIGKLPTTLTDRCIPIQLQRRKPSEPVARFRSRHARREAEPLRAALETWAKAVRVRDEEIPEPPDALNDRAQDLWEPLLWIARQAGAQWPQRARAAALAIHASCAADLDDSLALRLLSDLRDLFADRGDPASLFTSEILEALNGDDEAPWSGFRDGKGLNGHGLGRMLGDYGIKFRSRDVRVGPDNGKGFRRAQLAELWARYLPDSAEPPETPPSIGDTETSERIQALGEFLIGDGSGNVTDRDRLNSPESLESHRVTDQGTDSGRLHADGHTGTPDELGDHDATAEQLAEIDAAIGGWR